MSPAPGPEDLPLFQASSGQAPSEATRSAPKRRRPREPKPTCDLILFPLHRQSQLVDKIRRELFPPLEERTDENMADSIWRAAFEREAVRLMKIGLSKRDAHAEVCLLMDAAAALAGQMRRRQELGHP